MEDYNQLYQKIMIAVEEKINKFEAKILGIINELEIKLVQKIEKPSQEVDNNNKTLKKNSSDIFPNYSLDMDNFPKKIEILESKNDILLPFEFFFVNKGSKIIPMNSNLIFIEKTNQITFEKVQVGQSLNPNERRFLLLKMKIHKGICSGEYEIVARLIRENDVLFEKSLKIKVTIKISEEKIQKILKVLDEEYGILSVYKENYVREMINLSNGDKLKALSYILN